MKRVFGMVYWLISMVAVAQVTMRDDADNLLLNVNDEGSSGSLTLPSGTTPSTVTNKLYNVSGQLNWNGQSLTSPTNAAGWTEKEGVVYLSAATNRIGVGTTQPSYDVQLQVSMSTNGIPLYLSNQRGNTTIAPIGSYAAYGSYTAIASDANEEKFGSYIVMGGENGSNYGLWVDVAGSGTNWSGYFESGDVYVADQLYIGSDSPNLLTKAEITTAEQICPLFINNHRGGTSFAPASAITYGLVTSVSSDDPDSKFGIVANALGDGGTKYGIWAEANGSGTNWAGYFNDGNVYIADQVGIGTASLNSLVQLDISSSSSGCPLFINNHRGGSSFAPASGITYGLLTSVSSDDAESKFGIVANALGDGGTKYGIWAEANGTGNNWAGYFNDGNVYVANNLAIGTTAPTAETTVHVKNSVDDNFGVLVDKSGASGSEIGLHTGAALYSSLAKNAYFDGSGWQRFNTNSGAFLQEVGPDGKTALRVTPSGSGTISWTEGITLENNGNVGIGTTSPQGRLDVNGAIYQRGGLLHADYVFEPDYSLEGIEEHAEFMWSNKHLKAIPKATSDADGYEVIEVGAHRRGIVEELEKAHIYIHQLHERLARLESLLAERETER